LAQGQATVVHGVKHVESGSHREDIESGLNTVRPLSFCVFIVQGVVVLDQAGWASRASDIVSRTRSGELETERPGHLQTLRAHDAQNKT